jgi:hypothetical protein
MSKSEPLAPLSTTISKVLLLKEWSKADLRHHSDLVVEEVPLLL